MAICKANPTTTEPPNHDMGQCVCLNNYALVCMAWLFSHYLLPLIPKIENLADVIISWVHFLPRSPCANTCLLGLFFWRRNCCRLMRCCFLACWPGACGRCPLCSLHGYFPDICQFLFQA